MRILVVALTESVHLVRHLSLLHDTGWDVHVFPSQRVAAIHPEWSGATVYVAPETAVPDSVEARVVTLAGPGVEADIARLGWVTRPTLATLLAQLIADLEPDVLHTGETQQSGYLALDARALLDGPMPPWLLTIWGSDVYWHGRDPRQRPRLRALFRGCDHLCSDGYRDIGLARTFGFRGRVAPMVPVAGGFDWATVLARRSPGPTSARRDIVLKAQAGPLSRADVAVEALRRCGPGVLAGHRLRIHVAEQPHEAALAALADEFGLELDVFSRLGALRPHRDVLTMHGAARVSIALSRSDGVNTSFLEAAAMGSFPIQTTTSCAAEYARDGVTAAFVDQDDVDGVTRAITRALTDDALVDRAAAVNDRTMREQLDNRLVRRRVVDTYERIAAGGALAHRVAA